jgi:hypothetical protein
VENPGDSSTRWKQVVHNDTAAMNGIPRLAMHLLTQLPLLNTVACVFLATRAEFLAHAQ